MQRATCADARFDVRRGQCAKHARQARQDSELADDFRWNATSQWICTRPHYGRAIAMRAHVAVSPLHRSDQMCSTMSHFVTLHGLQEGLGLGPIHAL